MIKSIVKKVASRMGVEIRRVPTNRFKHVDPSRKFNWLGPMNIGTVLDIGANAGQFALTIRPFVPEAMIYSFEPLKDVCEGVARLAAERSDPKWKAINIAVGDTNGKQVIHRTANTTDSSLLQMSERFSNAYGEDKTGVTDEEIVVRRLDDYVAESRLALKPELLIKMDVQGYEDKVISGGLATFSKAAVVYTEVAFMRALYNQQPMFDDLHGRLRGLGFKCAGFYNLAYEPQNGSPMYADAVFLRA